MLECFDFVRQMNFGAIAVRLVLAVVCGGAIGLERELKRRPAGFRTHILICLGAAMTTLTSQYLYLTMHMFTDVARLGAQVIAGIGFIGAGSIIVTKRRRVRGLTTAAGLWASAIIGLVCGAGYIECAIFATVMILCAELLLIKIEYRYAKKSSDANLLIEYSRASTINAIVHTLRDRHITITDMEISRTGEDEDALHYCAVISARFSDRDTEDDMIKRINGIEDVINIEEL